MRLTLRTLLAYLDNVLDPQDAKLLQQRISTGQVARGLIERIQSVMRRPKLTAPKVDAKGIAGDANAVAEYLDNTLPAQQVIEFEQACLAEDARLAEVASCHQILALVLVKPASVTVALRDRIRSLPLSTPGKGNVASPSPTAVPDSPGVQGVVEIERNGSRLRFDRAHASPLASTQEGEATMVSGIRAAGIELDEHLVKHVPEYLKSGSSKDWSTLLTLVGLLAALFLVAWMSLGPYTEIQQLLHPTTIHQPKGKATEATSVTAEPKPSESSPVIVSQEAPPPPMVAAPPAESEAPIVESQAAPPLVSDASSAPPKVEDASNLLPEKPGDRPSDPSTATSVPSPTPENVPPAASPSIATSEEKSSSIQSTISWLPETKASTRQVLLAHRYQDETAMHLRQMASGDELRHDERLIIPPTVRTELSMAPGIRWVTADSSIVSMIPRENAQQAAARLWLGRALLHATPDCHSIYLKTPLQNLEIEFSDDASIVAIELDYRRIPGQAWDAASDAQLELPLLGIPRIAVICVKGKASAHLAGAEPIPLEVSQGIEWTSTNPARHFAIPTVQDIPWWFQSSIQRPIDGDAAKEFTAFFEAGDEKQPVMDQLIKASDSRHSETATLAHRTRFLLGDYRRLLGSDGILANANYRPHRSLILDTLYQSLGVDRSYSTHLKSLLLETLPSGTTRVFDLLSLPDDTQLAEGADRQLVEALTSPFIDERALGIYQLKSIVGKEFGYQCDRPSPDSIQTWKKLLNSNRVRWAKKP